MAKKTVKRAVKKLHPVHMVPCYGAAHGNPFIDHCGVCLNHTWGWIPAKDA